MSYWQEIVGDTVYWRALYIGLPYISEEVGLLVKCPISLMVIPAMPFSAYQRLIC